MKKFVLALMCFISTISISANVKAQPLVTATPEKPCVISAVGDSITYSTTYAAVLDMRPEITVKNYGLCASQVAGIDETSFVNRTKKEKFKSDIILIFGGTNDYLGNMAMCNPMGAPDDEDISTFFGAYNTMVKNIKKNNPKSKIVLITPIRRKGMDAKNDYGLTLNHYVLATQMVADRNSVACIDLFNNERCDLTTFGSDHLIDGLHPTLEGHTILAETIFQALLDLGY